MIKPRTPFALLAATALTVALFPAPAVAASIGLEQRSTEDVNCIAEFVLTFSPGFSMTPSTGSYTSEGESGTMTCEGSYGGRSFTGVGTRGEAGRYGIGKANTCADMDGIAEHTWTSTMPTDNGPLKLGGPVDVTYGFLQGGGLVGGTIEGKSLYGEFTAIPLEGDCFTTPLTKIFVRCNEWVRNAAVKP